MKRQGISVSPSLLLTTKEAMHLSSLSLSTVSYNIQQSLDIRGEKEKGIEYNIWIFFAFLCVFLLPVNGFEEQAV
jgi:hypothetical protein